MRNTQEQQSIPEIVRYFRQGRYVLGEVRDQPEFVILARVIGPRARVAKNVAAGKVVRLGNFQRNQN